MRSRERFKRASSERRLNNWRFHRYRSHSASSVTSVNFLWSSSSSSSSSRYQFELELPLNCNHDVLAWREPSRPSKAKRKLMDNEMRWPLVKMYFRLNVEMKNCFTFFLLRHRIFISISKKSKNTNFV